MSLLTHAYLLEKYGLRLDMRQLGEVLGLTEGTIYNQISADRLGVSTYLEGKKRYADYRDVAAYLDACRQRAA